MRAATAYCVGTRTALAAASMRLRKAVRGQNAAALRLRSRLRGCRAGLHQKRPRVSRRSINSAAALGGTVCCDLRVFVRDGAASKNTSESTKSITQNSCPIWQSTCPTTPEAVKSMVEASALQRDTSPARDSGRGNALGERRERQVSILTSVLPINRYGNAGDASPAPNREHHTESILQQESCSHRRQSPQ